MEKTRKFLGASGSISAGKTLKSRPLRMHFQHSGARVFGQNTDFIKFWLRRGDRSLE